MKTIIAGGRHYQFTELDIAILDDLKEHITEVVSGMCSGADQGGVMWARARGVPIAEFPARWNTLGKKAGPIRNQLMADYAQALIVFPGNKGTKDMITRARQRNLVIIDVRLLLVPTMAQMIARQI